MAKTQKNTQRPQGATPQPSSDTIKAPQEGGMPKTGFDEAGSRGKGSGLAPGGPGPGVSNSRRGIH